MKKPKPLTNKAGDVRELTEEDFRGMRPFREAHPQLYASLKKNRGRPLAVAPKQMIAFRFAPDLLAAIKGLGKGYNARVEKALRNAIEEGKI